MAALATAALFTWFGMVIAISFVEAPLKFRAPGVTRALGLGIGRLVFRALNVAEIVLAAIAVIALGTGRDTGAAWIPVAVAVVCLLVQVAAIRPRLDRRAARIIAGEEVEPSRAHLGYVALEGVKVIALVVAGALAAA
ncbi:hypothetical protein GCM10023085_58260 [Actinomadura viridis]|uniref:TMEM205-like domain-containing protein n=1 Tax=Actinomadura viridis TaxID=58110 RepID=A0A931GRY7_9ACTN|nr:DUF4149 domain-containing protein [Actinomadura viridis]MBG6093381.1 hypothetical protein [Actinomadura viridis]